MPLKKKIKTALKISLLLIVNIITITIFLYGFEYIMRKTDPFLKSLPYDSRYYSGNKECYSDFKKPEGHYTWGHLVKNNKLGFREREIAPKPDGVYRIMVLGDSLTWGAGLAEHQRYSNLVEYYLNESFSCKKFEVLNFALTGGSTVDERNVLRSYKDIVKPDLIVIGFCWNDPQTKKSIFSVERERFYEKHGNFIASISEKLESVGLPQIARLYQKAVDKFIQNIGIIATWEESLQRAYNNNSIAWKEFIQALRDIKEISDKMSLPAPIFSVLNQVILLDHPTDYKNLDNKLPIYLRWYHQAQQAAEQIGLRAYNHEKELIMQLTPEEMGLNILDQHPSAKANTVYAKKLFEVIASDVRTGRLDK